MIQEKILRGYFVLNIIFLFNSIFIGVGGLLSSTSAFAEASPAREKMNDKETTQNNSQSGHTYKFKIEPNNDEREDSAENRDINTEGPEGNPAEANLEKPSASDFPDRTSNEKETKKQPSDF
jgi:hypothetical protein